MNTADEYLRGDFGSVNQQYKTWNVPRRWAATVRARLKREAEQFEITMTPRAST